MLNVKNTPKNNAIPIIIIACACTIKEHNKVTTEINRIRTFAVLSRNLCNCTFRNWSYEKVRITPWSLRQKKDSESTPKLLLNMTLSTVVGDCNFIIPNLLRKVLSNIFFRFQWIIWRWKTLTCRRNALLPSNKIDSFDKIYAIILTNRDDFFPNQYRRILNIDNLRTINDE